MEKEDNTGIQRKHVIGGGYIYYIYDVRTKICYSVVGGGNSLSHSAVECTQLVVDAIKGDLPK